MHEKKSETSVVRRGIAARAALGLVLALAALAEAGAGRWALAPGAARAAPGPDAAPSGTAADSSQAASAAEPGTLSLELAPADAFPDTAKFILHGARRGDMAADLSIIRIPRDAHQVPFVVQKLDLPKGALVAVELRAADGRVLARAKLKQSEFGSRKPLVLRNTTHPLASGKYQLVLAEAPRGSRPPSDQAVYAFELQREAR